MNLNVNLDGNLDAGICAVNYNVHVKTWPVSNSCALIKLTKLDEKHAGLHI